MTQYTNIQPLLQAAMQVQTRSYSPYSNFRVGAALLADNDKIYAGCNVENVSYPLSQCAEASAIGIMIADGAKQIKEILVLGPEETFCPPCGGCRQKIKEFAQPNTLVHLATLQGKVNTRKISELLPLAFS